MSHLSRPVAVAFSLPSGLKQPLHSNPVPHKQIRQAVTKRPHHGFRPVLSVSAAASASHMVDVTTHSVEAPVRSAGVLADTMGHCLPKSGTKLVLRA